MEFTLDLSFAALSVALTLFALRVLNYTIGTIRLVVINAGRRVLASFMAFLEALIFAVVMASVIADLSNVTNLLAYCVGAGVGSYVGMTLESRLIVRYSTVTIITQEKGQDIAEALRANNYGVTVSKGEGRDGKVDILRSSTVNRGILKLTEIVRDVHPEAFIDVEAAHSVHRGWLPGGPARRR